MAIRKPVYTTVGKKELRALASSDRQEILDMLAQIGTVSVPELAASLGRPHDTLYYHLRILQKAGLVEALDPDGERHPRTEALYRARNLTIDYEAARRNNAPALLEVAGSMLRLGVRDFEDAVQDKRVVMSGKQRQLWLARKIGRLSDRDLMKVNRLIDDLLDSTSGGSEDGQLYGVTVLLAPLNRLRRGPAAAKRRAKKLP